MLRTICLDNLSQFLLLNKEEGYFIVQKFLNIYWSVLTKL